MRLYGVIFILFCVLIFSKDVDAYLDPGTGSYMLQILVATFAAAFFIIKQNWYRIKKLFISKFRKNQKDD
jgi:hypothetical protein